jgi:hypothetical protein
MNLAYLVPKHIHAVAAAEPQTFTHADLKAITRPCVYIFMKSGVPLYIGSSTDGVLRFASSTHHKKVLRKAADDIRVLWFKKAWEAKDAEEELIKSLKPPFNGWRARRVVIDDALIEVKVQEYIDAKISERAA